jgi:hypothetical protein
MKRKERMGSYATLPIVMIIAMALIFLPNAGSKNVAMGAGAANPDIVELQLSFPSLEVVDNADGTQGLYMDGYPAAREIGLPALPSRVLSIALPPGADVGAAGIITGEWYELPGSYNVEWGQEPLTSDPPPGVGLSPRTEADGDVYSSDAAFPAEPVALKGSGRMRGISMAEVRINPVRYYPASGRVEVCRNMSVRVETIQGIVPSSEELAAQPFDETVREIVFNFDQARQWYQQADRMQSTPSSELGTGDIADYVIITPESLATAVEPLKGYKETQGLTVQVLTTEWLAANATGIDLPEQIRNYLQDNYVTMGIDYVLLAGSHSTVPMRVCYAPTSSNPSGNIYSDYYYCDLSGDWDLNDDGRYGEIFVDDQAGGADFYPEVYVGRIPTDDPTEMSAICRKITDFQSDTGSWKHKAMLMGAVSSYLFELGSILPTYGSPLSQKIKADILDPLAYESTTMYEQEGLAPDPVPCDIPLTHENVLATWPGGYGIVNILAHGSSTSVSRKIWEYDNGNGIPESGEIHWNNFLNSYDTDMLDDSHPSIVFSCACDNARPTSSVNLMASLLKKGACATVGSTGISFYMAGWQSEYWGGNNSMSYMFWKYLLQDGYRIGKALRMCDVWIKATCDWLGNYTRANLFDFNLYGDPAMKLDAEGSPQVSGVDPSSAWNMGLLNIAIDGSNFLDGARVILRMEGQGDIEATAVCVESSTRISCTIDITGAQLGLWDVIVRNPDSREAVLEDGFEAASICGAGGGAGILMLGISLGMLSFFGSGGFLSRRRRRRA